MSFNKSANLSTGLTNSSTNTSLNASSTTTNPNIADPLIAQSIQLLITQLPSNIVWIFVCSLAFFVTSLQLLTIACWKPLRKSDQIIIVAIAVVDLLKTAGFGAMAIRRLTETARGTHDVASQLHCMIWLSFVIVPLNTNYVMITALSVDRFLALAFPIWYKNRKSRVRIVLTSISVAAGCATDCAMLVGVSDTNPVAVCAYSTSPNESYRVFSKYFQSGTVIACLSINIANCVLLAARWFVARRMKRDMKAFKKSIQMSALRTLVAVVTVYLITSGAYSLWAMIMSTPGLDGNYRLSLSPLGSSFEMLRGVLDFPLYVLLVQEYRNGFREVILKRLMRVFPRTQVAASSFDQSQQQQQPVIVG